MNDEFSIERLTSQLVRTAYPLAQALGFADFEAWRKFVDRHCSESPGEAGGLAVRSPHGYLCGLLLYRVDRRSEEGATLACDKLVATDMPGRRKPILALLDAADRIANETGCRWIRVAIPADGDPFAAQPTGSEGTLIRAGYALEGLSFRRRATRPPKHGAPAASAPAPAEPGNGA